MQIIVFLIIVSLCVAGGFLFAFFWAVRNGQYEDDYTPSIRLLIDDDMLAPTDKVKNQNKDLKSGNKKENVKITNI